MWATLFPLAGRRTSSIEDLLEDISEQRHERYGQPWDDAQQTWLGERGLSGTTPWDPENVTEDFELGLFLWQEDYDMALLDVVTLEELPLTVNSWIRQRTRWQKGKVYTFLQYLRTPPSDLWRNFTATSSPSCHTLHQSTSRASSCSR